MKKKRSTTRLIGNFSPQPAESWLRRRIEREREDRNVSAMERLAEALEQQSASNAAGCDQKQDVKLNDIQEAYDTLHAETGTPPTQRAVTRRVGYNRGTVRERWHLITKT